MSHKKLKQYKVTNIENKYKCIVYTEIRLLILSSHYIFLFLSLQFSVCTNLSFSSDSVIAGLLSDLLTALVTVARMPEIIAVTDLKFEENVVLLSGDESKMSPKWQTEWQTVEILIRVLLCKVQHPYAL